VITAFIPARLDSTRLPGKGLLDVAGKPMLSYLVERIKACPSIDNIVLITTDRPIDNPLVDYSKSEGIGIFRGVLENVLNRFRKAADATKSDIIIRANGDSPLLCPLLTELAIAQLKNNDLDFLTGKNKFTKLPIGLLGEFFQNNILQTLDDFELDTFDKEHVSSYIFKNPNKFNWNHFQPPKDYTHYSNVDLTVDTPEDFEKFKTWVTSSSNTPVDWRTSDFIKHFST